MKFTLGLLLMIVELSVIFGQLTRDQILQQVQPPKNTNIAKNVILIVGDDYQVASLNANDIRMRVTLGIYNAFNPTNISLAGSSGTLQKSAFTDPSCANDPIADRACATSALLGGFEVDKGTISIKGTDDWVTSIFTQAQNGGKRTGLVTNSRLTSPGVSPVYGHSLNADHESDADPGEGDDLALQAVFGPTGQRMNFYVGGGSEKFLPACCGGERLDGRNLLNEWRESKKDQGTYALVRSQAELEQMAPRVDYVMASMGPDSLDADAPLGAFVKSAIDNLNGTEEGFMLLVESSSRPSDDEATRKIRAAQVTNAIRVTLENTNSSETLILIASIEDTEELSRPDSPILGAREDANATKFPTIMAIGAHDYLFNGAIMLTWVSELIRYAACLVDGNTACNPTN